MNAQEQELYSRWQEKFPELFGAFAGTGTPKEIRALARSIRRLDDEGTLTYPVCDGAINLFSQVALERFKSTPTRSAAEVRLDRCASTRTSNGKKTARAWK